MFDKVSGGESNKHVRAWTSSFTKSFKDKAKTFEFGKDVIFVQGDICHGDLVRCVKKYRSGSLITNFTLILF